MVYVRGVVTAAPTYDSGHSNYVNMLIADADNKTNTLKVYGFKLADNVAVPAVNDIVVVQGYLKMYSSALQVTYKGTEDALVTSNTRGTSAITVNAEHATVTGIPATAENGTTVSFTVTPEDDYILDSVKLGNTELTATEGTYSFTVAGDAAITVVTHKDGEVAPVTITKTAAQLASANNWADSQPYYSFNLDSVITVSCPQQSGNNAKYYAGSGGTWRIYKNDGGTIKVDAASGYTIQSVSFNIKSGAITGVTSNTPITVNAATWTSGVCTSNAQIVSFTVTYIANA